MFTVIFYKMIKSSVIHTMLIIILMELISLESPTSPPHFSVKIGSKDASGEKSRMTSVFFQGSVKGKQKPGGKGEYEGHQVADT